MKIGIVVPFSWSFWGAVVEHAELQAAALEARGHEVRLVMGNDPPGQFTRALHPRVGRHGNPPANVIPVGRSVIVPANGSLPNIVLSPRSFFRIRRVLERERFDLLLSDIVMPEMDGIELAQRCAEVSPQTKVMFITGFAAVSLRASRETPQARVLSKPFHLRDLVLEVQRVFGQTTQMTI